MSQQAECGCNIVVVDTGSMPGISKSYYRIDSSQCIANSAIAELERLGAWVRDGTGYDRDDARDEIARAIENRVRQLKKASL